MKMFQHGNLGPTIKRARVARIAMGILLAAAFGAAAADEETAFPGFADRHTAGLWLFDDPSYLMATLTDAGTSLYDLRLLPGGEIVPGRFGGALASTAAGGPAVAYPFEACRIYDDTEQMAWDSRPVVPPNELIDALGSKQWTVECWLKLPVKPSAKGRLIEFGLDGKIQFQCDLDPAGSVLLIGGTLLGKRVALPADLSVLADGQWHHVAMTRNGQRFVLFLDGRPSEEGRTIDEESVSSEPDRRVAGLIAAVGQSAAMERPFNVRVAPRIDFYWGEVREGGWFERWRGGIVATTSGPVDFWVEAHDRVRLQIGESTLIEGAVGEKERYGTIQMATGQRLPIVFEFEQTGWSQRERLLWRLPGKQWEVVPTSAFSWEAGDLAQAMAEAGRAANEKFYLTLGGGRFHQDPFEKILIDELRVSDVVRHEGEAFQPTTCSRNFGLNPPLATVPTAPPLLFDREPIRWPVALGDRKHVFIDDVLLESYQLLRFQANAPVFEKPIDFAQELKEQDFFYFDQDVASRAGMKIPEKTSSGRIIRDTLPGTPPSERYKLTARTEQRGIFLWVSPDMNHWRRNETIMYPFDPDGGQESFWDDQRGSFVAYLRTWKATQGISRPDPDGKYFSRPPFGRAVVFAQTREIYKPWPFTPVILPSLQVKAATLPIITDELPLVFAPHERWNREPFFSRAGQVYRSRAIKYPYAPDTYVAFLWRMFDVRPNEWRATELATSRDGIHWKHYGEPFYFQAGGEMEPGVKIVEAMSVDALARRGDDLLQYAYQKNATHFEQSAKDRFVRYRQRLDGFVSLDAAKDREGWLRTRPLTFEGNGLELNINAQGGQARVAILDELGAAIPGFTLGEADPVATDSTAQIVTWGGASDLSSLAGQTIRLRIDMKGAKLYAFRFRN